jgi:hypothetical protein
MSGNVFSGRGEDILQEWLACLFFPDLNPTCLRRPGAGIALLILTII